MAFARKKECVAMKYNRTKKDRAQHTEDVGKGCGNVDTRENGEQKD